MSFERVAVDTSFWNRKLHKSHRFTKVTCVRMCDVRARLISHL